MSGHLMIQKYDFKQVILLKQASKNGHKQLKYLSLKLLSTDSLSRFLTDREDSSSITSLT